MDREEARNVLGLNERFTREEVKAAYLEKTKAAHRRGKSEEKQQTLNVARDTLNEELDAAGAIIPMLTRELLRVSKHQELISRRQSAKDDLTASIEVAKVRAVGRLHQSRDIAGILAALAGGTSFLRENIAEIMQIPISPWISSALLLTGAYLAIFAFIANRAARRTEEQTSELNRVLTRQRTIDRILRRTFAESDSLSEDSFEERIVQAIEMETGVRQEQGHSILPFRSRQISQGVFEDYIDFLIASDYVDAHGISGHNLVITRKKQ